MFSVQGSKASDASQIGTRNSSDEGMDFWGCLYSSPHAGRAEKSTHLQSFF